MEASSKLILSQAIRPSSQPVAPVPCDKLPSSYDDQDDPILGQACPVTNSFALPHHSEAVWKHDNLCRFFLFEQLHRRVIRVLFALTQNMADIWQQFDLNYCFHIIPDSTVENVLKPYVVDKPSIAVFGPTNSGKTTLLNVLLGKWWLAEKETPNTDVVWLISNGKSPHRRRRSVGSERTLEGGGLWDIERWMEGDMALKEKEIDRKECGREVFYDLKLPNHLLSCGVDLWDTPSLSYDKWNIFDRLIFKRSNVIPIFIVDAQECLGEDRDVRFIKTMRRRHPELPFLIVLGRIDVSLMQLRMDFSQEFSTLDSDDEEVLNKVKNCEKMRVRMQIPSAKFHKLVTSTCDVGIISADKVWEELSPEKPTDLRYTEQFNNFMELLLETHATRIQRPFYRIYARLQQAIQGAQTCHRILKDKDFDVISCLKESKKKYQKIAALHKDWSEFYAKTRSRYLKILHTFIVDRNAEILKFDSKTESRSDDQIEYYITNVLMSQAIGAANDAVEGDLKKNYKLYVREFFATFDGSSDWIEGIFSDTALKLSNDFLWDRSLIQPKPLKKYIQHLTSRFRSSTELQRVQRVISNIDFDQILSSVFVHYNALDNDVQSLAEISNHMHKNISLSCNLKSFATRSHSFFAILESRISLLTLLSSTLAKVHKEGIITVDNDDNFFSGPLAVEERSEMIAYIISLQRNKIENIEKSLKFVTRDLSIDKDIFLKPLQFSFDFRKQIIILYSEFGQSLHQHLTKTLTKSWSLQQAIFMAFELHKASEYFMKTTKKSIGIPDFGPQFIMLHCSADEHWRVKIVLMGEVGALSFYAKESEVIHLPSKYQKWKPDELFAYQVVFAFWLLVVKALVRPLPLKENKLEAWEFYMDSVAKDKSFVTKDTCWFFSSAFSSKSMKHDLRRFLKAISEKIDYHDLSGVFVKSESQKREFSEISLGLETVCPNPDVTAM